MSEPKERETINFGAGATATPTPTKTPTPSSRVRQFPDGKWYVVDGSGSQVSPGYRTQAMAVNAAEFTYPVATPTAPTADGAEGAAALVKLLGQLTGNPNMTLAGGTNQTLSAEGVTAAPAKPPAQGSSGSGSGTAAKATKPGVPDHLKGWFDLFKGLDDKAIVEAYYNGEEGLDRNILGQLLAYRNMDEKGVSKWTEASLSRYLDQIDAEKPLGIRKADLSAQFDTSRADFGAKGTFGSGSLGQGIREDGLFTPNSGGFGLVPGSDQSGNLFPAAAVVNNQLYPAYSAMAPDAKGKYGNWQDENRAFYNGISGIAAQRGMRPDSTLGDIGQSLQEQNRMMEMYGADPSRAMLAANVASGAYNPANDRIDPSSGRPAGEMNEMELLRLSGQGVFRAQGGPVRQGQPYIVGENRPEVFVPEQNGTILPNVPRQRDMVGEPVQRIPRQYEYGDEAEGHARRNAMMHELSLTRPNYDRLGDPRAGMIGTLNPRLAAENNRRYFMENARLAPQMEYMSSRRPEPLGGGGGSIFEKALLTAMQRRPMGMA